MPEDNKTLVFCKPGTSFPTVSVTGDRCDQMCEHCMGKHLLGMRDLDSALRTAKNGMLISGGCDVNGAVPAYMFYDRLKELSDKEMMLNLHTGFSPRKEIEELGKLNIVFSVDVHQDPGVISSVLHLNRPPSDYSDLLDTMMSTGRKVVPHLTVGFGTDDLYLSGRLVRSKGLEKVVLLSMVPTEGTAVENVNIPEKAILSAIDMLNEIGLEVTLGCMRDRRLRTLETKCIEKGVTRIANPSNETVEWAKRNGFKIIEEELCCSISL